MDDKPNSASGRIEVLGWREHGDDDDSTEIAVFAADDKTSAQDLIAEGHHMRWGDEADPEERKGYVITEETIANGEILTSHDGRKFRVSITEVQDAVPTVAAKEPEQEPGNTCPKCGGHSFRLQATFSGEVCVTFTPEDDNFEVDDSEAGDSEWDGPATCRDCGWYGTLADLLKTEAEEE